MGGLLAKPPKPDKPTFTEVDKDGNPVNVMRRNKLDPGSADTTDKTSNQLGGK